MSFELPTFESVTVTLVVTIIRTTVEAAPTILGGVLIAAWLRTLATPEKVASIFRGSAVAGLWRTVLVGMTLPVCSVGVLPVLRELRRLGLSTGKLITLGVTAPLLNPISLLYGLTLLSGSHLLVVLGASAVLAVLVGDVSGRFAIVSHMTAEPRPAGITGGTRLRNLVIAATRIATGWPLVDLLLVAVVSGLAASLIPAGTFSMICAPSRADGPLLTALLTLPQYVGPAHGIIQQVAIEKSGLSISSGLVLYVFGVGLSAANILLLTRWFGIKRMAAVFVASFLFVGSAAVLSAAVVAAPAVIEETSGFDNLTRPLSPTLLEIGTALSEALKFTDALMVMALLLFVLLVLAGGTVRFAKIGYRDDPPETDADGDGGRLARAVPASQLGAVAICGFAVLCGLATYIFFPGPADCVDEMQAIQMDANIALRQGNIGLALQQIDAWDAIAAKLPVSAAVHFSFPSSSQRQATRELRMALYRTRLLLREGDMAAAIKQIPVLSRLQSQTRSTFKGDAS